MSFTAQNFMATTSPANSFLTQTQGYTQGMLLDDPSGQNWITTGIVASTQTTPIWPGLPIVETTPASDAMGAAQGGNLITTATTIAAITGWTVINQAYNMIITNSNNVPMAAPGMSVSIMRLGSLKQRIVVPVNPADVNALLSQPINVQLQWDFTNNWLTTFSSGTALSAQLLALNANSKIVSYTSGTQVANWSTGPVAVISV